MNKQERITLLMSLLQASLNGKEIEQNDCGHFYDSTIYHATIDNVHQFRVKPNVVTKKYRVALFKPVVGCFRVGIVENETDKADVETSSHFDKWLTPWMNYTVEE